MRQKVEGKGIFVHCFTGVDVEIVRGISIFNDTTPIIGLNDNDRYPAKTFSIIHELVHTQLFFKLLDGSIFFKIGRAHV